MVKYDLEVVMEFYANAWPIEERIVDKRSWMQGHWIPYDTDAINECLGASIDLRRGTMMQIH